ncbi:hypothetical protein M0802_014909 [Mischocyttarus mexicanus]|nr:hypothetical protein M0802_014909 [Mischocyttarus mexicanus]
MANNAGFDLTSTFQTNPTKYSFSPRDWEKGVNDKIQLSKNNLSRWELANEKEKERMTRWVGGWGFGGVTKD